MPHHMLTGHLGPHYPGYPTQPYTGSQPTMYDPSMVASDLRYSSSTAPIYQSRIERAHGRNLAGLGEVLDEGGELEKHYPNELRVLAAADDVEGNGVFDAPNTHGNSSLYPDAGIFAGRFNMPGYLAREKMYAFSEVVDATTGRPIYVVPNSPVAMDSAAQVQFIENQQYAPPRPVLAAEYGGETGFRSITNVRQNPQPIRPAVYAGRGTVRRQPVPAPAAGYGAYGADAISKPLGIGATIAVTGAVGLAVGALIAILKPKKKGS